MVHQHIATNTTPHIIHGWVSSPNKRGSLDILQACLATVFLCTYSVLFLNIKEFKTRTAAIRYKTKWVLFTIFFPEVTTAMAAEQWRSARQSVAAFARLRNQWEKSAAEGGVQDGPTPPSDMSLTRMRIVPWTARHAFFADMGGLRLKCPDFPEFPINSSHFFWLVENKHIEYPVLQEKTILDKNKADALTRAIMLLQVSWFTVEVVARSIQHLSITTLELSTLAFACSTLHSFWFWRNKPLDVVEPVTIVCNKELKAVINEAAPHIRAKWRYSTTPLDFLDPEAHLSYVEPFFYGMSAATGGQRKIPSLPVSSFSNAYVGHSNVKPHDVLYAFLFMVLYFGVHLAAWPFHFPTRIESLLWRASAITLACIAVIYELACCPGNYFCERIVPGRPKYAIDMAKVLPRWILQCFMWPLIVAYFCARTYIVVEGFVSLRALPASAFESVNWWNFVPHF